MTDDLSVNYTTPRLVELQDTINILSEHIAILASLLETYSHHSRIAQEYVHVARAAIKAPTA